MSSPSKPSASGANVSKDAHQAKPSQADMGQQHGQGKAQDQKQQQQHSKTSVQPGQSTGSKGGHGKSPPSDGKS